MAPSAVQIAAGRRTRVLLSDARSGHTLVLQNLSSGSRSEVYGDSQGDALVKVVTDSELQQLIDVLAAQGMFAQATQTPAPGARAVLAIDQPERRFVWSRPPATPSTIDQVRAFDQGRGYVMAVYNAATSYHSRDLEDAEMAAVRAAIERAAIERAKREQARAKQTQDQRPPR